MKRKIHLKKQTKNNRGVEISWQVFWNSYQKYVQRFKVIRELIQNFSRDIEIIKKNQREIWEPQFNLRTSN